MPLREDDRRFLCEIGLPAGPRAALTLNLRFETVTIEHDVRHLRAASPEERRGSVAGEGPSGQLVVVGRVPAAHSICRDRLVAIDGHDGSVWWLYAADRERDADSALLNRSLTAYVSSLFAYRQFRSSWSDLLREVENDVACSRYRRGADRIHARFIKQLKRADEAAFSGGFWECHAWNERILLDS